MRHSTKKTLLLLSFLFSFSLHSFADHIVGGDLTVKWISGNNFEVTMQFFRDCNTTVAFDSIITLGIYSNNGVNQQTTDISNPVISNVPLGNSCYTPTTCIEKAVYTTTVTIPNNSSGYYISYHRCCRSNVISNIIGSSSAGYIIYCEIPDPGMHNSTPTFNQIPDGFMCRTYLNSDDFSCTDVDGDSLVYDFISPLDCSTSPTGLTTPATICSYTDPVVVPWPKRPAYGNVAFVSGYTFNKPLGDPNMTINPSTGIVTCTPPNNGVYVFCVRVQEYRSGVKIGEIRRDFQFQMLPCPTLSITGPPSGAMCLGTMKTLDVNSVGAGFTYSWSPGGQTTTSITVTPTTAGIYNYTVTATKGACVYTATTAIKVNSNPTQSIVTGNNVLCRNKPPLGSATVTGLGGLAPYTYQWITSPVQTTAAVTGLTPGTYSMIIRDANACSSIKTVIITQPSFSLTATTTVTDASSCSVNDGTILSTPSGGTPGYSYLWNNGQTTQTATGLAQGTYTVTITDMNNCTYVTIATVNCPTSTKQLSAQSDFVISPNPTNGKVEIRCTMYKVQSSNAEIVIYNFLGEKVYEKGISDRSAINSFSNGFSLMADLSSQPNGIYFLQVRTGYGQSVTKKIIKQ